MIELVTDIRASSETCFDLARDIDSHRRSMDRFGEEVIAGCTTGLIEFGETVTWRARHFGLTHLHTAEITAYDRPRHFRDEMVEGRFAEFLHDHYFEATDGGTRMRDVVRFRSPLGPLGAMVDALVLKACLRRLLESPNQALRLEAEALESSGVASVG